MSSKITGGHCCLPLVTYHFSKGDPHRGCAGHGYDTAAARAGAVSLVNQIERVFGASHACVYPIVVGIETDEDSLVLHGKDDQVSCSNEPNIFVDTLANICIHIYFVYFISTRSCVFGGLIL